MLDGRARRAVPLAGCFAAVLLLNARLGLPGAAELLPGLLLGTVFFWSIFQPNAMPAIPVFLLGLFSDLLADGPLGMTSLLLLGTHGLAIAGRELLSTSGLISIWLLFCLVAVAACSLQWAIVSLLGLHMMAPAPALFEAALACAAYPPLSVLFAWANRSIINRW
jgi:rod shape-determining protein MreD